MPASKLPNGKRSRGERKLKSFVSATFSTVATKANDGLLHNRKLRNTVLGLATFGLAAGLYFSVRSQPDLLARIDPRPLALVAGIGVPFIVVFNAIEFTLSAKLLGKRIPFFTAVETTVVGSAANMLPLPGGTMVRIAALKSAGSTYRHGTTVTLLIGLLWLSIAFIYAGYWIYRLGSQEIGGACCAAGIPNICTISLNHSKDFHKILYNSFSHINPRYFGFGGCLHYLPVPLMLQ